MVSCEVCGGEEFEKHAGFMYCAVCQTQSQDYHEQAYEYTSHELNTSRKQKSQTSSKKHKKQKFYDDGFWTTWEGFNYILHGMSQELKTCGVPEKFGETILKLWAAYLRECQVAFTSKYQERIPKLKFRFKQRDARFQSVNVHSWCDVRNMTKVKIKKENDNSPKSCHTLLDNISKCRAHPCADIKGLEIFLFSLIGGSVGGILLMQILQGKLRFFAKIQIPISKDVGCSRKRKLTSRSSSRMSVTSDSSLSKRSLVLQKGKVIAADYQDHMSCSLRSNSNLGDETLESLGRSSELETTTDEESGDDSESLLRDFRHMFTKKDFKVYKDCSHSKNLKAYSKEKARKDMRFPGKNKLLSIIHLALLLTGSQIQLSDLLRFIRESHLSFAKVTHFFPNSIKFPKGDLSYMEVISDALMPTHLQQRSITGKLALLLKVEKIPTPDMNLLVDRYCQDLNLPKQIALLSKKVVGDFVSSITVPRSKTLFPSYEAWAMVSIIFVMKLLLGLNDRTEIFLSFLAGQVNSKKGNDNYLFVFNDWQKYIECRKTILTNFHYPTQEQLGGSSLRSSKNFLDMLTKESKDEYRSDRFIPYSRYYIEGKLIDGVKQMLEVLTKPLTINSFEFKPSLTPQISHVDVVMQNLPELMEQGHKDGNFEKNPTNFPWNVLQQSFEECDVNFAFDPIDYLNKFDQNLDFIKCEGTKEPFLGESLKQSNMDSEFLFDCSSRYWIFDYPNRQSGQLRNFKEEIFDKTPQNFQWFVKECARMLEMNVRDVYGELLRLEKKLSPKS